MKADSFFADNENYHLCFLFQNLLLFILVFKLIVDRTDNYHCIRIITVELFISLFS